VLPLAVVTEVEPECETPLPRLHEVEPEWDALPPYRPERELECERLPPLAMASPGRTATVIEAARTRESALLNILVTLLAR
jgi:hypothetical protein